MSAPAPPGGRVSGDRLRAMLGLWRRGGQHHGAADLAAAIGLQAREGRLPPGTRLPAERELAAALGVSRTLVGAALDRLRNSGMVASRQGSGSWITVPDGTGSADPESVDGLIDLARASPAAVPGLVEAVDAASDRLGELIAGCGYNERGLLGLRERIAERYTARGLPTDPDQVLVTNGAHHAFALVLRTFCGPGDRVLVEQPSYPNALVAIQAAHALPVPVAVEDGWDVVGIEAALRQAAPRLAYFIADFQNPTGQRMTATGRERLGAAIVRSRTPIVVDETLAELDLTGDPVDGPPPLAAYTADGTRGNWAISIGSAAKTYWGGLRIGWIRAGRDHLARIIGARAGFDLGSPLLEQLVVAELLAAPADLLRMRRRQMAAQRDALVEALGRHCPQWTFDVPDGGLCLWCRLPAPMSTRLAVAAAGHGVQVVPGARFGAHGGFERRLRLPYTLPAERIVEAVSRLGMAAASMRGDDDASRLTADVPVA